LESHGELRQFLIYTEPVILKGLIGLELVRRNENINRTVSVL